MAMTGFICHDDYLGKTAKLTDQELGRLFRACMTYHATGEPKELTGREGIAFDFIREDIDRAEAAYKSKCEKNKQNRLKAIERTITNVDERKPSLTEVKPKREVKRFTPPTVDEVKAYCNERRNNVDPEQFVAFYSSKGWKVGDQPMKDWKQAVITWEKRQKGSGKTVNAQQYTQRSYTSTEDEILDSLMA